MLNVPVVVHSVVFLQQHARIEVHESLVASRRPRVVLVPVFLPVFVLSFLFPLPFLSLILDFELRLSHRFFFDLRLKLLFSRFLFFYRFLLELFEIDYNFFLLFDGFILLLFLLLLVKLLFLPFFFLRFRLLLVLYDLPPLHCKSHVVGTEGGGSFDQVEGHIFSPVVGEVEPFVDFFGVEAALGRPVGVDGQVVDLPCHLLVEEEPVGEDIHVVEVVQEI